MQGNIIKNFLKNIEKMLAFRKNVLYNQTCCDMIALKREVAAEYCRFSVERMSS